VEFQNPLQGGLYQVWIRAGRGPNGPLVSVWIDPQMRAYECVREQFASRFKRKTVKKKSKL
jgi:hypothetical protein